MALTITDYLARQLANDYTEMATFDPLPFNPTLYARFDTHAYQDLAQSVPAVAYGDQVRQLRDFREAPGGSTYPFLHWDTAITAPVLSPQLSAYGGSYFSNRKMLLSGLTGVPSNNFTAFLVCVPAFDYPNNFSSNGLYMIGDTFATGVFMGGTAWGNDNRIGLFTASNNAGVARPTLSLSSCLDVLSIQSTPAGITFGTAQGEISGVAASTTGAVQNGTVGDDSRLTGNWSWASVAALLVFSPALSSGDYAAVRSGLLTQVPFGSLWPRSWPFNVYLGNSRTMGVQVCPVTTAQTYPAQSLAALGGNQGYLIAAKSGMRIDQIQAAYAADVLRHLASPTRPDKILVNIEGGTNDAANGDSGATIFSRWQALGAAMKGGSATVNILTNYANAGLTSGQATQQAAANSSLLSAVSVPSGFTRVYTPPSALGYVDVATDVASNPDLTDPSNVTYFNDGTHNTSNGYLQVATDQSGAAHATST